MKFGKLIFLVFFIVGLPTIVSGQETPPIINFSPSFYNAGNQNWDLTEDELGNIHVANNEGLLVFNGAIWELYPSPSYAIIRSVASANGKVYIGSYMEFGYYQPDIFGKLEYHSLSAALDLSEDEIIWHIQVLERKVIFQSLDRLYIFDVDDQLIQVISESKSFVRTYVVDGQLFIKKKNSGIYKLEKGELRLQIDLPEQLKQDLIVNIFKLGDKLLIFSRHQGIYELKDGKLTRFYSDFDVFEPRKKIFSAKKSRSDEIFIGTISEGLIKLDKDGKLQSLIKQGNGLSNNTVINIFEDSQQNIWLALDNGVDCLNNQSLIKEYNNSQGVLGTVYATLAHQDGLYLGSNQGLFFKPTAKNEALQLISGTEGQVWSLISHEGEVFCGHAQGVFLIKNKQATLLANIPGVWDFKMLDSEKLLFGSYSGLNILEKRNGAWNEWYPLKGFDFSSRFFEISDKGKIWVNHENKGIYQLKYRPASREVQILKHLKDLPSSPGSALAKFDGKIFYSSKNGVFELNDSGDWKFQESLSRLIDQENYISAKLISDPLHERLWSFRKDGIAYARKSLVNDSYELNYFTIPDHLRRAVVSFENIRVIGPQEYLLGKTNGYIRIDFSKVQSVDVNVRINQVIASGDSTYLVNLYVKEQIPYRNRSVTFAFSVPYFEKYQDKKFSYRLIGYQDDWTAWGIGSMAKFEKLPFGTYTFEVKSSIAGVESPYIASFEFEVLRPFYLSNLMLLLYCLILFSLTVVVHKSYKKYFHKKAENARIKSERELESIKIKNEQKITDLKNRQLQVEIESKNRELAILTMNNIKRNDFLRKVKKELKSQTNLQENSTVFKLIESNLNNKKDWDFFEEAFNNADKEFLERAKKICPELNRNDLKFCTYIRLNLSAKEIASLLNISTKSVEIKRYRLRKKLGLGADINLTDFILSI